MKYFSQSFVVISFFGLSFVQICGTRTCTSLQLFSNITIGNNILGSTFLTLTGHGVVGCAKQCLKRSKCKFFSYTEKLIRCELRAQSRSKMKESSLGDTLFTDIDKWPRRLAGLCWNHTCPGNAVCLEMTAGDLFCKTECPDPRLKNGRIKSAISRDVGTTLKFICSEGYVKKGKAVCRPNGSWSGFYCEKGCIKPPIIKDAFLEKPGITFRVGSVLNYTCISPLVRLGRVECTPNFTWSEIQCIPVIRNCHEMKMCNTSYGDGEYWLVPEIFVDKPVKIYCHNMFSRAPQNYLTLPEENNVNYSNTECLQRRYHECRSTRFEKVKISNISTMEIRWKGLRDLTFTNQTAHCYYIQFGSVHDCHETCRSGNTRDFVVDTRHTGLLINPSQKWSTVVAHTKINLPLNITKFFSGRVILGRCHQPCNWCYPTGNIYTLAHDPDFLPELSAATLPECEMKYG